MRSLQVKDLLTTDEHRQTQMPEPRPGLPHLHRCLAVFICGRLFSSMIKKIFKYIVLTFVVALVVAQFIRPAKNIATAPQPADFMVKYPPSANVKQMLTVACYDCHSNTTRYPWYAEVQPLGWWLKRHVSDGKAELNFSEFADYSTRHKRQKLETAGDEVRDHAMPLPSYLWTHRDARLTPEQMKELLAWFDTVLEKVEEEGD